MIVVFLIQISEAQGLRALSLRRFMLRDPRRERAEPRLLQRPARRVVFYRASLQQLSLGPPRGPSAAGPVSCSAGWLRISLIGGLRVRKPNVTWAVVARVASGLLNGTIGIIKSHVSQITDATNRPTAFSLFPVGFGIGIVSASYLGGALARPADSWPGVFGSAFWETYPYALPLLVCAVYQFVTPARVRGLTRRAADGLLRRCRRRGDDVGAGLAPARPLLSCRLRQHASRARRFCLMNCSPLRSRLPEMEAAADRPVPGARRRLALIGSFGGAARPPAVERQRVAGLRGLQPRECAAGVW